VVRTGLETALLAVVRMLTAVTQWAYYYNAENNNCDKSGIPNATRSADIKGWVAGIVSISLSPH
jgi:hypothetical protein